MIRHRRNKKWLLAFSLTELMAVSAIVTSIPAAQYARVKQKATQMECVSNMTQIGKSIVMYHMSEGKYPEAIFFPKKPFSDDRSIAKILADSGAGIPRQMWVCPAAPGIMKKRGISFIYNDKYAGRQSLPKPGKAWLMIEVNCVSAKVPPPHPQGYNILFADGRVITTKRLPKSITAKQQAAIEDLRQELESNRFSRFFGPRDDNDTPSIAPSTHTKAMAKRSSTVNAPSPCSLRAGAFQRIRSPNLRKRPAPLHASRTCATGLLASPVTRPGT